MNSTVTAVFTEKLQRAQNETLKQTENSFKIYIKISLWLGIDNYLIVTF